MDANGGFTFVINGHLPFLPHTHRSLVEFAGETLIPLLHTLNRLKNDDVHYRLTIGLSPLLVEQLNHEAFAAELNAYYDDKIARAQQDAAYFQTNRLTTSHQRDTPGDPHLVYLGEWYASRYQRLKAIFNDDLQQDTVSAFRDLQDAGLIEIAASAATHAYLPLLAQEDSIKRQVDVGVASYERTFGRRPTAFWLPQLGYSPGIEAHLEKAGIQVFVCESHMLTGGPTVGVAAGQVMGIANEILQKYVMPQSLPEPVREASTLQPYYVGTKSKVAVVARDNRSVMQVAGSELGYPGDVDYLATNRYAATSGLRYWRVTGHKIAPADKDYYHPDWATYKVDQHSEHFAHLIGDMVHGYFTATERYGLIAPVFDMRLFGSWWFEGCRWLEQTLRHLAKTPNVELTSLSQFTSNHPPAARIDLLEGSWGVGGGHFMVDNPQTRALWQQIHAAEARLEKLRQKVTDENTKLVYEQAVRELMLMQSSDWAVMMAQSPIHATQVFETYAGRFERLAQSLEDGTPDVELVTFYQRSDHLFSGVELVTSD